ncbi:hypothetical protein L6452_15512 [Arctium lappa]|uniref:Uncharacterized protein n=1 Tax=Arctium lappa TaxID=4217 RepID=A0ACB9CNS0_ARCLA|nr:hypothetical protein L6452_15512 [Arctium lappa]
MPEYEAINIISVVFIIIISLWLLILAGILVHLVSSSSSSSSLDSLRTGSILRVAEKSGMGMKSASSSSSSLQTHLEEEVDGSLPGIQLTLLQHLSPLYSSTSLCHHH